jgi:hypothetical protein
VHSKHCACRPIPEKLEEEIDTMFYKKVEQFVIEKFSKAGDDHGIKHFLRTVYWIKVMKPDADEALLIAAIAHDIERGDRKNNSYDKIKKFNKGFISDEHLSHHQNEGAKIIMEYLQKIGADKKLTERVRMLISKHEVGGNDDQNLLKDADSVSFFENNVEHFIAKKVNETSKEKVKDKFDWMFNRIISKKAKKIARPWYEEAIKRLGY